MTSIQSPDQSPARKLQRSYRRLLQKADSPSAATTSNITVPTVHTVSPVQRLSTGEASTPRSPSIQGRTTDLESGVPLPDSRELNALSSSISPGQGQADNVDKLPARLKVLRGFPRTTRFLAADPDRSWVVFRRFNEPAIRNLLMLQARVAALADLQKTMDREDFVEHRQSGPVREAAGSWESFALLGASKSEACQIYPALEKWVQERQDEMRDILANPELRGDPAETELIAADLTELDSIEKRCLSTPITERIEEQRRHLGYTSESLSLVKKRWCIAQALQAALTDYEEAMIRYRKLAKLERPATRTTSVVQDWVSGILDKKGAPRSQFADNSALKGLYDPGTQVTDMVGLGTVGASDQLSQFLSGMKGLMKHGKDMEFEYPTIDYIPESWVDKVVTGVIIVFASIWVIGAVWFLWLLQDQHIYEWAQLILLTFFVATFGLALTFGTTANRAEVFGATAAYSAVLVVFLGASST